MVGHARLRFLLVVLLSGCGGGMVEPDAGPDSGSGFTCTMPGEARCVDGDHLRCVEEGGLLHPVRTDCTAGAVCIASIGCASCVPGEVGCAGGQVVRCRADGSGQDVVEACDVRNGLVCRDAVCTDLCALALEEQSYEGCEFYAADLDNAVDFAIDASAQQYAVIVSNPGGVTADVVVEQNDAAPGETPQVVEVARASVPAGDLEVFELPRREVDGSSDTGRNDGTGTALTARAYRIRSRLPVIAYQFNPFGHHDRFSSDAALLLPTSGLGVRYTVVGWPQTLGPSVFPEQNSRNFPAFLAILGVEEPTHVRITLGPSVLALMGADPIPAAGPGDVIELDIGPFDVVNLETERFAADFTGTLVESDRPVAIFSGNEATDVPTFRHLGERLPAADHLEEQLLPDRSLGRSFAVIRTPSRARAINGALVDPERDGIVPVHGPEWVRILGVSPGTTDVRTSLPAPNDRIDLAEGDHVDLRLDQDVVIDASAPVSVLQLVSGQAAAAVPWELPGGDPASVVVPPIEQYRRGYVILTPNDYAFDYVIIAAPGTATVWLDDRPVTEIAGCESAPADGRPRDPGDPLPDYVGYRCQLSYPVISRRPSLTVEPGMQDDGVHRIDADAPVGVIVYGFDRYVSYAYPGGLDLARLE